MSEGVPMHVKTIEKAHAGPIFDLWANETSIFSAGKDSRIQNWRFSLKLGSVDLQYLKTHDMSDIVGGSPARAAKSVSVRVSPPALVVGLSNNEVYEIDEFNNKHQLLVRGHGGGHSARALNRSLAAHPAMPHLMLSGGADGLLVLWDMGAKKSVGTRRMHTAICTVAYSCSGHLLAVGLDSGEVFVQGSGDLAAAPVAPEKQRTHPVYALKFAPNDQFLAAGSGFWIDVYDIAGSTPACTHLSTLKGHEAIVTEIDWDKESMIIRTTSAALELLYWDVHAKEKIKDVKRLDQAAWDTHHCKLGWYTKGVMQNAQNEHTVMSVDVARDERIMAVSNIDGQVHLLHFPCIDAQMEARSIKGHASVVTTLKFSWDGSRLMSVGGKDQSVFQWRILDCTLDPLVQVIASKAPPDAPLYAVPDHDDMPDLDQIKELVLKRFSGRDRAQAAPSSFLDLDFVHGYSGHDNNSNLFVAANGDLLFHAGALCVVYDTLSGSQQFFCEHQHAVMAMALHADGLHVASADAGSAPAVCVWDLESMNCLARLDGGGLPGVGPFESGVSALAFSSGPDAHLLAVGTDKDHSLYLLDWRSKSTIAASKCGSGRVLACAWSPFESHWITCGVLHLKFWTRSGAKLVGRDGVFGKREQRCTMQCLDVNPVDFAQHAGKKGVTLTGGMDGRVYMFGCILGDGEWRPEVLNDVVAAHEGPVFDICHDQYTLLVASCGGDGLVKTWKLRASLNPKDRSKTDIALVLHETIRIFEIAQDLPVHVSDSTFGKSLVLRRTDEGPRLLIGTNTDEVFRLSLNAESKVQKDEKTHHPVPATLLIAGQGGGVTDVITHPTRSLAFSTGRDGTVKMWDLTNKCLSAVAGFKSAIASVDLIVGECPLEPACAGDPGEPLCQGACSQVVVAAADGTILLLHAAWMKPNDDTDQARWGFSELSRATCCRAHAQDGAQPVEPTAVRVSRDILGERFVAVGRSDGLIDFFKIEQQKITNEVGIEVPLLALTALATTGADGTAVCARLEMCRLPGSDFFTFLGVF